jgi:hypothetical protein
MIPRLQIDRRLGGEPRYVLSREPIDLMRIPDQIKKCVVFVGHAQANGEIRCVGTAFLIARRILDDRVSAAYFVTAKHVIQRVVERSGYSVFLRLNFRNQEAKWIETDLADWHFHPDSDSVDVAVLPYESVSPNELLGHDHISIPSTMATNFDELDESSRMGAGDEVFFVGLFSQHIGTKRNIPIIRVGTIAAMPEEPIAVTKFGAMDAYLVEARSIGGLSGSPVFLNPGPTMEGESGESNKHKIFYLIGMIHGHWDSPDSTLPSPSRDRYGSDERFNMGIAIVIPIDKVNEVLNQKAVKELEARLVHDHVARNSPTPDIAKDS